MSNATPGPPPLYRHLSLIGLFSGVGYWVIESAIDAYIFSEESFYDRLVRPDLNEAWMRVLVILLLVLFGGYAQRRLSERRIAKAELQHSDERFAKAFRVSPVAVVLSRLEDGHCIDVNDAFLRMCGYKRDEVIGRSFLKLDMWENPDQRAAMIRQLRESDSVHDMEASFRSKSGGIRIGRIWAERIMIGDEACMIAITLDVTDRKRTEEALRRSEEQYRNLANEATDAIITIDETSTIIYVNQAAQRLFGYPPDALVNKSLSMLIPSAIRAVHHAGLNRYLETGKRHVSWDGIEFAGLHQDGHEFPIEVAFGEQRQGKRRIFTGIVRDISERKKSDEALLESEERFRLTLNSVTDGGWDWNIATGEVFYSDRWIASLGYQRDEVDPHIEFWKSIVHPDDMPHVQQVLQDHFDGKSDYYECENRLRMKSGAFRWNLDRGKVVAHDADGQPIRMVGTDTDITDRKRAEEALRRSHEELEEQVRLRTADLMEANQRLEREAAERKQVEERIHRQALVFDIMYDAVILTDMDRHIMEINPGAEKLYGYSREELIGRDPEILNPPDEGARITRMIRQDIDEHGHWSGEIPIVRADGTDAICEVSMLPLFDKEGRQVGDVSVSRDITERKRAEGALRRTQFAVDHAVADAIFWLDRHGLFFSVNDAACKRLGYSRDELLRMGVPDIDPSYSADKWPGTFDAFRDRGFGMIESSLRTKSGQFFPVEISVNYYKFEGTEFICAFARDITERKQAEAERSMLEEQLRRSQKMEAIGTFSSGITHDFDNLLTAIFAYTDLAKTTLPKDHPAARNLEKVEQAAHQARNVTNALLTFSHGATLHKSPVNLSYSLQDTIRLITPLLPASINIEEDIPSQDDLWIHADAGQIPQIVMNLTNNARDAMPSGGRLSVSLQKIESNDTSQSGSQVEGSAQSAVITIHDTGGGMNEEVRLRVFEPFFTTKPRGQGTGLGMSLVHGIVEDLGGKIEIASEQRQGTSITLTLPCCDPPAEAEKAQDIGRSGRLPGQAILVVEANHHIRSIMVSALRSKGYEVIPAANMAEAITAKHRRGRSVRMLILDLDSVDDQALGRVKEVQSEADDMLLVCLAGTLSIDMRKLGLGSGYLLRKPFQISEFTSTVSKVLSPA
ncbi:MAG: PAS domain S-box protein [Phycisphaerae bacterium]